MKPSAQLDPAPTLNWGSHRRQVILESAFMVLLIATAFVVRIWPLSKTPFWDEAVYLQNAEVICCDKANYSELDSRPPLLSLVFAAAFLLWHHIYAASIANAFLNALGPAFLYLSGRMVAGRIAAAIASLLLAFSPYFVDRSTGNSLLSDSPALTLILLSFWLLLRAIRKQTDLRFACAGVVLALTVLMRFASLSSVGVISLLVLAAGRWRRAALACAAGFAAGIGPYLCWSRLRYDEFFMTFRNGWQNFQGPKESPLFYLQNFGNIFSWITLAGLALWIGRWVWDFWKQKAEGPRLSPVEDTTEQRFPRFEAFLWLWAAALLVFFSAVRHQELRYALPLAPPLLLLAGIGLSVLLRGRRTAARVAGTALLVGALAYTFLPVWQRFASPFIDNEVSEEAQVSDFLNHNFSPSTVLYSNFNYPVFAYYTNLQVYDLVESGPALYDVLNRLPDDGILVAYKKSDEIAEPSLEWLDSNPHFRRFREFPSIVLYEYHASGPK